MDPLFCKAMESEARQDIGRKSMTVYADDIAPVRFPQHIKRNREHSKVAGTLIQFWMGLSSNLVQMHDNISRTMREADPNDLLDSESTFAHIKAMGLLSLNFKVPIRIRIKQIPYHIIQLPADRICLRISKRLAYPYSSRGRR